MARTYLDDDFFDRPTVEAVGGDAQLLYIAGLWWCNKTYTGGVILATRVPKLTDRTKPLQWAQTLVDAALWHETGHGCPTCPPVAPGTFLVHDYADENWSAEKKRTEKASKAARARWAKQDARAHAQAHAQASAEHCSDDAPSMPPAQARASRPPSPLTPVGTSSSSLSSVGHPSLDEEDFAVVVARRRLARNREHVAVPEHWLRTVARNVRAEYAQEAAGWTGTQLELADLLEPAALVVDCPTCDNHGVYETPAGFVKCTHDDAVRTATGG